MTGYIAPAYAGMVSANNIDLLYYSNQYNRNGSASSASVSTYNASQSYAEHSVPLMTYTDALAAYGTVQVKFVTLMNITARGTCTSLTVRQRLAILGAAVNTGAAGSTIDAWVHGALTTGAGTLPLSGWVVVDSFWQSVASLATNISGYGLTVAALNYQLDTVGGNPTIGRIWTTAFVRVA